MQNVWHVSSNSYETNQGDRIPTEVHGGKAVFRLHYIHICTFYVTFSLFHWVDKLIKKGSFRARNTRLRKKMGDNFCPNG